MTTNNDANDINVASDTSDAYEELIQFLYRTPIGLVQIRMDGEIEMLNPMSARLLMPLSRDGALDNLFTVLDAVAPELRAMATDYAAPSGPICDSARVHLPADMQGQGGPQILSVSLMKLNADRMMAVVTDATLEVERERKKLERGISRAAQTDSLTRMPNQSALRERLRRLTVPEQAGDPSGLAVLYMNCDRFRQINDRLGHAVGDQVLMMMAERLRAALRVSDRILLSDGMPLAARMGGDEFVVVLDATHPPDIIRGIASRLLDALCAPYLIGQHQIMCNVSMGIAMQAAVGSDANGVLQDASIAMVEAKHTGGGRVIMFEPAMRERAAHRSNIEAELRRALAVGELFVVYQPVVGLRGAGIDHAAGVEALVRWRHPVRGIVPPVEFIGVAEECGLIGAVGDYVLTQACRDFVAWQKALGAGAPRRMAVNLSRAQLAQPGWTDTVARILRTTGMPAASLQLEVTESLAAQDAAVQEKLLALKALGVTLALDDFGTGYSSLSSLHQLPVDTVKIDRSFVSQSDTSRHHRVLIEATVRVAHSLEMRVVAEGIETEAQAEVVRALGCEKGQGYFFSKPLTAEALVEWLGVAERSAA